MEIALVTFYPEQRGRLAEYADMLVSRWEEEHEVSVICQERPEPEERSETELVPSFDPDDPLSIIGAARDVKRLDPDVTVFNQSVGLWGQKKTSNMAGMALPLLTSLHVDTATFTILHNVYEGMDRSRIERVNDNHLLRAGVWTGMKLLLRGSDRMSVTRERYKEMLESKYGTDKVTHIPHGVPVNGFTYGERDRKKFTVLAFGHWSPNKRLELLLDAYEMLDEDIEIEVCGTSHPDYPGYIDRMEEKYPEEGIRFQGFVPQSEVEDVFGNADLVVLPYTVSVGTSGVLNLAMGYGVPVLATDNNTMREISEDEESEIIFAPDNSQGLAREINSLKEEPEKLEQYARRNYSRAKEKNMDKISNLYIENFREEANKND